VTNPIRDLTSCSDIKVQQGRASLSPDAAVQPTSTTVTSMTSHAWAGNVATGQTWTQAQATWNVPVITGGSSAALSSQWAGVGQGNTSSYPLYQAGTEANVSTGYNVWTEVVPQQSYAQVQRFPNVNDQIWVRVSITSTGAQFQISDQTVGWSITINWTGVHQTDSTAEFIDERPLLSGNVHSEYATQNVTFKSAQVYSPNTGWILIQNAPHFYYNMKSCNDATLLAYPGPISSSGDFTVYGVNSGGREAC